MKLPLTPTDVRPHVVLRSMAAGFVLLATFFILSAVFDLWDGQIMTRAGSVLRAESPELFAKMTKTSFGFGVAMIVVSVLCAWGARRTAPKS